MHAIKKRLPWLIRNTLEFGQRFRINISPAHFYSETPDLRKLRTTDYWRRPWPMTGVHGTELDPQLDWVRRAMSPWLDRTRDGAIYREACKRNGEEGFGPIEGDLLYGFMRTHRPPKIIQIGCGVSTQIMLVAAEHERARDANYQPELVCIDPYPSLGMRTLASEGRIRLLAKPAETVGLTELTGLEAGGLLFVDSTHSTKVGGEVPRLIFEVLPALGSGVMIHFHDIYFPYDYGTWTMTHKEIFFNRESPLLHAFLTFNDRFEIAASMSMLTHAMPEKIKDLFPIYPLAAINQGLRTGPGEFPSSLYLRTVLPDQ